MSPGRGRSPGAWLAALPLLAACARTPKPPNVVVWLADTLRRDHLGLYGHDAGTSPRLDAFAAGAVVFDEAYSPTSWTRPATATLLTGLWPEGHQAQNLTHRIPASVELLGEKLAPLGYHTAAFVTNANVLPVWGFDQGFEHFDDVLGRTGRDDAEDVVLAALEHLDRLEEPFFLYLHTVDPHGPYDPPEPYRSRFLPEGGKVLAPRRVDADTPPDVLERMRAAYDGEVACNDAGFGRLLDGLEERGLLDESLVVFASDHGDEHGDHQGGGHAHTLFQELVHVPLVVRFPGGALGGRRCEAPAGLVDVVPTVLAAVGAPPAASAGLAGLDLAAVARDPSAAADRVLHFDLDMQRAGGDVHVARAVLAGGWKLIHRSHPREEERLYDLGADPGELRDLEAERPDEVARLRRLLSHGPPGSLLWQVRGDLERDVRVTTGRLRTEGAIRGVRLEHGEEEDRVELAEDRRTVSFRLVLRNYEDPYRELVERIVDEDVLVLELEPLDAPLVVEAFEEEGAGPAPLRLGSWDGELVTPPVGLHALDPRLVAAGAGAARGSMVEVLGGARAGGRLVLAPSALGSAAESVEMDPETRARLQDLGYVE